MKDCGTILIVDSDDASRLTAVQVAVRLGYDARPTPTADELIDRLGPDRPKLAIVEVELPGPATGLEVMRQLHEAFDGDLPGDPRIGVPDGCVRPDGRPHARGRRLRLQAARRRRAHGARQAVAPPLSATHEREPRTEAHGNGHARDGTSAGLSPREREILSLLADGRTQGQIATELVISSKTVATHIQHILSKLGVNTRAQAVALAFRRGLVEPDVRAHALALLATPE